MDFGLIRTDIQIYVSYKFEMYISKTAPVINENERFAYLYVLNILILSPVSGERLQDHWSSGYSLQFKKYPSRKHLRTKVTPDFHLTYSKNGGYLGSESK